MVAFSSSLFVSDIFILLCLRFLLVLFSPFVISMVLFSVFAVVFVVSFIYFIFPVFFIVYCHVFSLPFILFSFFSLGRRPSRLRKRGPLLANGHAGTRRLEAHAHRARQGAQGIRPAPLCAEAAE